MRFRLPNWRHWFQHDWSITEKWGGDLEYVDTNRNVSAAFYIERCGCCLKERGVIETGAGKTYYSATYIRLLPTNTKSVVPEED